MNAWDVSDETLKRMQNGFVTANASKTYHVYLYQNDYTPVPGADLGDFTVATFPGAVEQPFIVSELGSSSVTDHVAVLTLNHALIFEASASGSFLQLIYGYVVFDELYRYAWSERFETTYEVGPSSKITVTPRMKSATCAAPTLRRRRRSAATPSA